MGLLDLPAPALSALNDWLTGFLPTPMVIVLWAAAGAMLSMEIYRLLSPQRRIARMRQDLQAVKRRLDDFDGPFREAWRQICDMLSLALRRVALVVPATLVAMLPVLVLIVWADAQYGRTFPPPGENIDIRVTDGFQGYWQDSGERPSAKVSDGSGAPVADVEVPRPVPVIHKKQWWNALIGNPAGYLPEDVPFERIDIALPRQEFIGFGPAWLRGWEPLFFLSIFMFALGLKTLRRIE